MTKFNVNNIVKIKKKIYDIDKYYQHGQNHYRKFCIGEIGRIFNMMIEHQDPPFKNVYVQFQILKLWIYHKNGNPTISYCLESELVKANKSECEKYVARELAERL